MTGYVLAECIFILKAELQDTMALSTIKVEYMAAVEASKNALWLRELVNTFGIIHDLVWVYCISQSVILAKDHSITSG